MNNILEDKLLTPIEAARHLNVSKQTLVNWDLKGLIPSIRTVGGHRRFRSQDIFNRITNSNLLKQPTDNRRNFCYARVSTYSQKEDLERQVQFFRSNYPNHEIIKDIGSGINFKRKGFNTLLELAMQGKVKSIVVSNKDRLCRFGFEFFEKVIKQCSNGEIMVLNNNKTTPREELCNDLITILTVFSSRFYGFRSNHIKRQLNEQTNKLSRTKRFSRNKTK